MAYVPPHKRQSNDTNRASLSPEQLVPQFKKNLKFGSSSSSTANRDRSGKIVYGSQSISRWFAIGCDGDDDGGDQFPASVSLQPVSVEAFISKKGEKPLALVNTDIESNRVTGNFSGSPWLSIADYVLQDLLSSYVNVKNEIDSQKAEGKPNLTANVGKIKRNLTAKVGKILFHGSPLGNFESPVTETRLRQLKRSFYTNIPSSYVEYIIKEVVPDIGVDFVEDKEIYHLSDATQPDSTVTCRCSVRKEQGDLQLYKIELNRLRYMVVDISCLEKNLDLRLMLSTKEIVADLSDDDVQSIRDLINSAILDANVKGGLRWPLGKSSTGTYKVIGVWHTVSKSYKSPSLTLKVRDADRYDYKTSIGETSWEISLNLKALSSKLEEKEVDMDLISEMLKTHLKQIWNSFMCCERYIN
nr:uncharacterized protein LOC107434702 isoform X2 [Ziziphus jujuba var. spinosa]